MDKQPTAAELAQTASVVLAISGMGCPNCAARVRNSLLSVTGVSDASVDHAKGVGLVIYNPTLTNVPALGQAVALAGGDGRHEYRALPIA
jgi:Cd2+/Zn2+-exporting ATPase/Cu+-exporting ATPase